MEPKSISQDFPVICVGGSAGGLDDYTRFLRHLPADMGVAIVIVNHLRTVATLLYKILPRVTKNVVESFLRDGVFACCRRLFAGRAVVPIQSKDAVIADEKTAHPEELTNFLTFQEAPDISEAGALHRIISLS